MRKIEINFTNKWLYTLALIIGVFALGVGVYATSHPNPGHTAGEVDFSGTIATLNAAQICLSGDCQTAWPSGGGSLWTQSGNDIYYGTSTVSGGLIITTPGEVGIGTSSPQWGRLTIEDSAEPLAFRETGVAVDNGGLWRMVLDGGTLRFDVNTGSSGNEFGTNYFTPLTMTKDGVGIILNAGGQSKPTCDASKRGMLYFERGNTFVDQLWVCLRLGSLNVYGWKAVAYQ